MLRWWNIRREANPVRQRQQPGDPRTERKGKRRRPVEPGFRCYVAPPRDHMGGLAYLLRVNPKVKIYSPKEGFGVYGADLPSTFYRKGPFSASGTALLRRCTT